MINDETEIESGEYQREDVIQLGPPDEDSENNEESLSSEKINKEKNNSSILQRNKVKLTPIMFLTFILFIISVCFIRPNVNCTEAKQEADKVIQILSDDFIKSVVLTKQAKEKAFEEAINYYRQASNSLEESNYEEARKNTDKILESLKYSIKEENSDVSNQENEKNLDGNKNEVEENLNKAKKILDKQKELEKKTTYNSARKAIKRASSRLKYAKESGVNIDGKEYKEASSCLNKAKKALGRSLYLIYFIIYILFALLVYYLCILLQQNTTLMETFYRYVSSGNGKYTRLSSDNKNINRICEAYKKSFIVSGDEDYHKTRANSDLYFGVDTWLQDLNRFSLQAFLKIIPGTFIGFGILGTFIGFSEGLTEINVIDGDMQSITSGVQLLLEGLRNAFNTSIVGVLASVYLNFFVIHPSLNKLDKISKELCDYLDSKFYVTEVDAMAILDEDHNLVPFPVIMNEMMSKLDTVASNIIHLGNTVGSQVSESIKSTMDEAIEETIQKELKKFKEELNSIIETLSACSAQLQAAPQNLKEASGIMMNVSKDSIDAMSEISKQVEKVNKALDKLPQNFLSVAESIDSTSQRIINNSDSFSKAFDVSTQTLAQTADITSKIVKSYESQVSIIDNSAAQIDKVIAESNQVTKNSKELLDGYSAMDEHMSKVFAEINKNTEKYSSILSESLIDYFKQFQEATKDISKQFAEATAHLSEEIEKLNSVNR